MITLKENERLVYAGESTLRAPNGTPLPAVPQYMIVPVEEAASVLITEIKDNERLVLGGVINDLKSARERFAALKAGKNPPPIKPGIPIYFKVDAGEVNPKTGFTYEEEKIYMALAKEFWDNYYMEIRKKKALERQGIKNDDT